MLELHSYVNLLILQCKINNCYSIFVNKLMHSEDYHDQIKGKTKKGQVIFTLKIADYLRHLYNQNTKRIDFELRSQFVTIVTVFEKQLDQPLPWFKKFAAKLINVKTKHEFIIFELESGIVGSIDFYDSNKIVLRLGNKDTILEINQFNQRKNSSPITENQSDYKTKFLNKSLTLGNLIQIIYQVTPADGYNKIRHNGSHFSRDVMKEVRKQKKGVGSVIRSKLVNTVVGFEIILDKE